MSMKYTARCTCGAVQFGFNTDPDFVASCHCLDCKRASGGEAATFFGVPQDDLPELAEAASQRAGNHANPRPATAAEILELFRRIY